MGQPLLVVAFVQGAGLDEQPQRGPILGLLVRPDDVPQAVRQRAEMRLRVALSSSAKIQIRFNCFTTRTSKEGAMYSKILIPTDGSELAGKAVEHGVALAKAVGARITILTVTRPYRPEYRIVTAETAMEGC